MRRRVTVRVCGDCPFVARDYGMETSYDCRLLRSGDRGVIVARSRLMGRRYSNRQRREIQTCGRKRRYATARGARLAAEGALGGRSAVMAAYICPVCDGIHLTSSPRRDSVYLFEVREVEAS